ncbi:hypothetical protein M406DRAFT_322055 [Cryphonectria parasitica EP155]|uniref:Uncharacterized protein n=1 Tax=Cryphonectria parasitica (strain ATCC 38755 / EP155) TaxID=660469 RepID=A0A9P5CPS3_CRYP1|nr:uncharacterized protein M406DRAFT_322055 [Cryphonectria parasitica EP155]KAF3765722.1 hypothetical protein M406DRAFT_322055 [Cryphonectria parasitica EP155]
MPSLNTSIPLTNWGTDLSAASGDWSYDITSPTLDSTAFNSNTNTSGNNNNSASAYNSGAGTPIGAFTPGLFSRQDSGDSIYQYQERRPQPPFRPGLGGGGGGSSSSIGTSG